MLDRLHSEYNFPQSLYTSIKKSIEINDIEDLQDLNKFVDKLPINLKTPLSICIYENLYENVDFLKKKTPQFISWICPLLKARVAAQDEIIYYEGDDLNSVYFLRSGLCQYVLPKYAQTAFVEINDHTCFGLADFLVALLNKYGKGFSEFDIMSLLEPALNESEDDEDNEKMSWLFEVGLKRSFTVRCADERCSELFAIDKQALFKMKMEFRDEFVEFFRSGISELKKMIPLKMHAIEQCEKRHQEWEENREGDMPNYDLRKLTNR